MEGFRPVIRGGLFLSLLLATLPARADEPPAGLACLQRWYAVKPVRTNTGWVAKVGSGEQIAFDLGSRPASERLESPSIKDIYRPSYVRGAWKPQTIPEADPGRNRVDALFRATYGALPKAVEAQLNKLDFFGTTIRVHEKATQPLTRVIAHLNELTKQDSSLLTFLRKSAGSFSPRKIEGTNRASAHAYGIAIDLNPEHAHYWRWTEGRLTSGDIPPAIVAAFEDEGFIWGGRWYHFDTMHFEWRPELLDPACQERL